MISKDMDWTRLRNRFLRTRSNGDKEAYNKQRKNSISYIWKTKQDYNKSLDQIKVARNKSPGKYIKSFFCDKNSNFNKIKLVNLLPEKDDGIKETFNNFFTSVASKSNILCHQEPLIDGDQMITE